MLIDNRIKVAGSSGVGLLGPPDFIGNIMLIIGPRVVSLGVWADVGVAVLGWIG